MCARCILSTTHTQPCYGPFYGLFGASGDNKADTPTVQLGATPSGLIIDPPVSSPIFTLDAPLAATLPIYPGLGQVPSWLAYPVSWLHTLVPS